MPEICCVLNCPHVSGQCQFRSFPKDSEKSILWKRSIRQSNMVIKKQTRICDCHFDSGMFWHNKEGKKYLKPNSLPSITVPKSKDIQVQKIINVSTEKNINKEETTFQLQFVQGTMNTQGKRRYSDCYENYDPGPKRQKTDGQFETEGVPLAQKEVARVVKRNQVESESPSPAHKQAVRAPKRSQVESEGILPDQKEVARARKGSQTENNAPSAHEVAKVTKRSQIESGSTPPAQKVTTRAPKRSQVKNQSASSTPNDAVKAPKNVQREVPSLEKTKVAKPPDKEVPQAPVTGAKTTPKKKWCKLDDICRLCIKKCNRPSNVYDSDLVFKIQAISSIREMCLTDGLPANVCQDCKDMTNIFFSFKLQCEAADETLRSCLKALQAEESNDTVVKQQTVAKPLFPELFKFSAFSSDDESDNEEVDSEVLEEEEEEEAEAAVVKAVPMVYKVPAAKVDSTVKAVPVVQAVPTVKATPVVQAAPAVKATPVVQAAPAVKATPVVQAVPAVKAAPTGKAVPAVKAAPTGKAVPAVKAAPTGKAMPAVKAAPTGKAVPAVKAAPTGKAVPAVRKVAMIPKVPVVQTAIPSTSTRKRRDSSPPSTSLQDELDKAWTEFSHEKGSLVVMRKNTTITRQENKPQYAESKDVAPKRKSVTKIIPSPKPTIFISPTMQKEFGLRKDEPQKESTPQPVFKPQLLERQNKSLHTKADLMKYLGNNVEVIQQKPVKGPAGKVLVKMVNNPKRAFNTKVEHEIDGMKLQQKISDVNVENKADKQNGSGENVTTKSTVLGSDSLFKVQRRNSDVSEMKKLGPGMSAFKVGALGQNVEIYRIPGQKPKPLISNPVVVENKSPTTSKTKDLTLQRTQIQEKTAKIQESNGHIVQASKTENSPLCHIEIFKVQNHSDKKLCLTALEGTEVSLHSVAQVPSTKLVSLANKLEQNLQPVVTSSTKNVSDSAAKLEDTSDDKEEDDNAELDQRLEGDDKMHESSTSDEGNSEQNLVVESADDDAPATSSSESSDPKVHLQDADDSATHSELTKSDAKVVQEESDVNIPATEKHEENLEAEVLSNAKIGDDSTASTAELEQTSQPDNAKNSNAVSPTSEKLMKTFPRPCKSISLPSPALPTAIPKKTEETVENLELKEHEDATQNKIEDESEKIMEVQEQEECVDMAKSVETENVSDITQNIVEELLNGAAMFVDAESVGSEVPLALSEPERKTNETEPLNDILGSAHETELSQDISKLIEQSEEAVDVQKVEDKKEADKPDDTTSEKQSETEEMETVEEVSKLEKISEEYSQDTSDGGAVIPTDCDEKSADRKRGSDRTDDERQCHICAKSFPASALQRHIASHWCEKDLLCEKCGISFFFPADLERHVISHGPQELAANKEDSSPVKQQQQQQQQQQQHKLQPPPPKATRQRTFTCGACGLDFTNWFQLRDHKLIHKKGKRHRCGSCSKHFRTKYLLQNHMWVHTMLKKPNCELCGKTFSLPWYVDRHITEEHS